MTSRVESRALQIRKASPYEAGWPRSCKLNVAGVERIELSLTVLETAGLPLTDTPNSLMTLKFVFLDLLSRYHPFLGSFLYCEHLFRLDMPRSISVLGVCVERWKLLFRDSVR